MAINQTDFFLDFKQFGDLKLKARGQSDDAARAVARQFEGLFLQQMLATMRSAAQIDGAQHSSQMDFYQEMYDKQLAQTIAGQEQGLGVAKLILQQMPADASDGIKAAVMSGITQAANHPPIPALAKPAPADDALAARPPAPPSATRHESGEVPDVASGSAVVLNRVVDDDFAEVGLNQAANPRWEDPQQFVADIFPLAHDAAAELGVSPNLLVAQAALETGWGKHTMQRTDGRSSHNLFGIKAGDDWQGASLSKPSLEYSDGVLQNRPSRFRAYDSPQQSLADYVDFIRNNPRYRSALTQADSDQAYIREIQRAGYATDPHYADKVIGIMRGEILQDAIAGLKPGETDYA